MPYSAFLLRRCFLFFSCAFLMQFIVLSNIAFGQEPSCKPYLIDINKLKEILLNNIRNSPFSNPRVTIKKNDKCKIMLQASVPTVNLEVEGCASPIHDKQSIGLSDIYISKPIIIRIPSGLSDVKDKIVQHCGKFIPIQATQTVDNGVFLMFD